MMSKLLRHFPAIDAASTHQTWDYIIAAVTCASVAICMAFEASGSVGKQYALGCIALVSLMRFLRGATATCNRTSLVAVAFTTIGE